MLAFSKIFQSPSTISLKAYCNFQLIIKNHQTKTIGRNIETQYFSIVTNIKLSLQSLHPLAGCHHLRNVLGTKHLAEILSERETISHVMEQTLDEATDPWGVKVERVEM